MEPNGSPIAYPTVTIDGKEYSVKFSMLAQYVLDDEGIDTRQLQEMMTKPGAGKVALFMKLFAAGVAHHFVEIKAPIPTAAEWSARLGDDSAKFGEIVKAVKAAMGKAPSPADAAPPAPKTAAATDSQDAAKPN